MLHTFEKLTMDCTSARSGLWNIMNYATSIQARINVLSVSTSLCVLFLLPSPFSSTHFLICPCLQI